MTGTNKLAPEEPAKLHDWMRVHPVVLDRDATLDQALEMLENYRFRHLPVVEGNRLVGLVSDRDLRLATGMQPATRRLVSADGTQLHGPQRVSEIMQTSVVTLAPEDALEDAALLMAQRKIGAIPVVHRDELVGIVTETNCLRAFFDRCRANGGQGDDLVRVHMRRSVPSVSPETPIDEALELLDRRLAHLLVTDPSGMVGIVSERDLFEGLARELSADESAEADGRLETGRLRVSEVQSRPVITVGEGDTLCSAAFTMMSYRLSALPVLDESGSVTGMITQRDILAHFVAIC